MKNLPGKILLLSVVSAIAVTAQAAQYETDKEAFENHFKGRFPDVVR